MFQTPALARTAKSVFTPVGRRIFTILLLSLPLFFWILRPLLAVSLESIINISPEVPVVNQSVNIKSSLRSSQNFNDSIVNFEVYDSNNQKVFQYFFEHQNLSSSQVNNYEFNWTPKNVGKYIIKIGLFNQDWSRLYYWEDKAYSFDISGQPSSSSLTTSVTYTPETPKINNPTKIDVLINPNQTGVDRIIDFEIYNSSNQKVFQQFFEHQSFSAGKTVNYQLSWTPTIQGQYQLRYGIFTSNWQTNIVWNNNLSTVDVSGQSTVSNTPQNTTTSTSPASSVNLTGSKYEVGKDGRIYKDGQKIILKGVSWFGSESGAHAPHGLWARNWQDMVSQIKSVGFNAVRVPFCPSTLKNVDVSTIEYIKNPDLQGLKSLDVLDKVVNELNIKQLYILLDHHTPDCQALSDLWYTGSYSESQWIQDLVFLANRYKNLDYFIGLDIKNEPKGPATWGTGNPATDWNLAAQKAGKEILSNNPNILIFVQGIENNPVCSDNSLGHWWGGNLEPQKCKPIDSNFIPETKLVFTPHVYGPDVFDQGYFNTSDFPKNLPSIWDKHFGFLKSQGKAVVIGEFGGRYGHQGNPKDVAWQNSLIDYMISKGMADSFYWSWNPNSGDTGGILQDDWTSVWQDKIELLKKLSGSF